MSDAAYILRPWKSSDVDSLVKHANNKKISDNLRDAFPYPYTTKDAEEYIALVDVTPPLKLAIEVEGEACGGIGVHRLSDIHRKNAELGYWLSERHWGKGIMTQAVQEIVVYSFKQLDIERIFAIPFGKNIASHKVLEKAGFQLEAKLKDTIYKHGEFHDEYIYAIRRKDNPTFT